MKPSLRVVLLVGTGLLVGAGALLRATAPKPEPIAVASNAGIVVETFSLVSSPLQHRVRISGLVEARRRVELFAEQDGRVLEVGAEELDRVEAGQLLLRIDPLPGEVEVARAEAALAQAKSELGLARAELERSRKLASNRVSSDAALERAHNDERVAIALHRSAKASLRSARDRLERRSLEAPFDGVLREFNAEAGEYVTSGQRLGELLDISQVRVTIGLRDRDVVAVEPGMGAEVYIDARPDTRIRGTVTRVGAAADTATHKFPVQIEMDNAGGLLLPGMVAVIDLELGSRREALTVPHDAVLNEFGLPFVYVVSEEGGEAIVRRRRITAHAIPFQPGSLEVTEGLRIGEQIATTSLRQLRDGSRVEPRSRLRARADLGR